MSKKHNGHDQNAEGQAIAAIGGGDPTAPDQAKKKKHQKRRGTPAGIPPEARSIADRATILRAARLLEGRAAVGNVDAALDRLLPLAEKQARRGELALLRLITRWHGRRMDTPDQRRRP